MTSWARRQFEQTAAGRISREETFSVCYEVEALASEALYKILLRVGDLPTKCQLLRYSIIADVAPVKLYLYEAPTVSNTGTELSINNKFRGRNGTSQNQFFRGVSTSNDGDLIEMDKVVGDKHAGGAHGPEGDWFLRTNTDYLFVIENANGNNADVMFSALWVEDV